MVNGNIIQFIYKNNYLEYLTDSGAIISFFVNKQNTTITKDELSRFIVECFTFPISSPVKLKPEYMQYFSCLVPGDQSSNISTIIRRFAKQYHLDIKDSLLNYHLKTGSFFTNLNYINSIITYDLLIGSNLFPDTDDKGEMFYYKELIDSAIKQNSKNKNAFELSKNADTISGLILFNNYIINYKKELLV